MSPRERATPGREKKYSMIWNSTWVRSMGRSPLRKERLRRLRTKSPEMSSSRMAVSPLPAARATRRYTASTRATSSEGEKGFVT